jgi:hypothetical protein
LSHSALLLRTERGRYYTLEYMGDSQAHVTEGTPALLATPSRQVAVVAMKGQIDGQPTEAKWECDLTGPRIQPKWSAGELQQKMQSLMRPYSVWRREHCHTAQERLRRELRILR